MRGQLLPACNLRRKLKDARVYKGFKALGFDSGFWGYISGLGLRVSGLHLILGGLL